MRSGKAPGSFVMTGTENGLGKLTVEALKVNEETALAHVITLVGRAQKSKAPIQRTTDRIVAAFIPFALLAAIVTYAVWVYFSPESRVLAGVCAMGVLVAACPVALGLAAPTAVVAGMGRAARAGILFRDGAALERFADINTVLFDKTGTITEGQMKLIGVESNMGITADEVLSMAAAIERGSIHPIGLAIVWEAAKRNVPIPEAEQVEEVAGKGIRGVVNGRRVAVGRMGFLQECGVFKDLMYSAAQAHRVRGNSVVFIGVDVGGAGVIVLNDAIRSGAKSAIADLRAAGVKPILVTGDHTDTAEAVARSMEIDDVVAEMLPAEKYAVVQKNKNEGKVVAMCGDGINDAPALAAADVGIAMGTGTEIAVSTAGVSLVRPDLRLLLEAKQLSRRTVRTIRTNLILVFIYTAIAIPIAGGILFPFGGGLVSPVWQAAGIALTSLFVLGNSRLLGRSV
jgi:Cu+-exporting ATPase